MRVLILTPTVFPKISGNAVTAERWRRGLTEKGIDAKTLAAEELDPSTLQNLVLQYNPDIIHVHHAFRSGALLLEPGAAPARTGPGIVVSPGGTDINEDLADPTRRDTVLRVFKLAHLIIAQSPHIIRKLELCLPSLIHRIAFVPKTVCWFGEEAYDLREAARANPGDVLFFLPAGIRPVKGNLECLKRMEQVYQLRQNIRFVAAGPPADKEYACRFEQTIARNSAFACWINCIPFAAMRSAYLAADVVLNASFSEGLSNSLIEAIAAGKPVLAADIQGNRWPVLGSNGAAPSGLLYSLHDPQDFLQKALKLVDDGAFRASFGQTEFRHQIVPPDPDNEVGGLIAVYLSALSKSRLKNYQAEAGEP